MSPCVTSNASRSRGFSMIEVLIALLVLALGLLGLALMQTMNLRFTQSANYRTVATNLSYEILDMVRVNQRLRNFYNDLTFDSFPAGELSGCDVADSYDPVENMARWRCQVRAALPGGEAAVVVNDDTATVTIRWTDARWEAVAVDQKTTLVVVTTL